MDPSLDTCITGPVVGRKLAGRWAVKDVVGTLPASTECVIQNRDCDLLNSWLGGLPDVTESFFPVELTDVHFAGELIKFIPRAMVCLSCSISIKLC